MEILDFGIWDAPPIGTEMIFHPIGKRSYLAIVTRVSGHRVTVEYVRDIQSLFYYMDLDV